MSPGSGAQDATTRMQAVVVKQCPEGPTLRLRDVPAPIPQATELLVRIRAAGLNRSDLSRTQKHYAPGAVHIAGNEMSGEVIGLGADVEGFSIGDRVMGLVNGGYAEQVCLDHRIAMKVQDALSWETAACLPAVYMTAHNALCTAGRFAPGEAVLVHAVTSGVGIAAVQIAKLLGASRILGTTRDPAKAAPLRDLGLDAIIDTRQDPAFADRVMTETGGSGVPVILDAIGTGALPEDLKCAALAGRIVLLGFLGGNTETLDLDIISRHRLSLIGVSFRTRTLEDRQAVRDDFQRDLGDSLADGSLVPQVYRTFRLSEALAAQDLMKRNTHLGKIVLLT